MVENESKKPKAKRPKSKTPYPWYDLDTVIGIAERISDTGGGALSAATLARNIDIALDSGPWRLRMRAGHLFGLLSQDGELITLTETARRIIESENPAEKREVRAEAFRSVPLFRGVMDELGEGKPIPPPDGLDDLLKHKFGIVENRVREAREMLLASARQAGVMESRGDKQYLVMPRPHILEKPEVPEKQTALAVEAEQGGPALPPHTVVEMRLIDEELDSLDEDDIKALYAAMAQFEAIRRKARRSLRAPKKGES